MHKVHEGVLTPFSGVLKVEGLVLWDSLSATCKDLIKRLMTPNAEKRLTAAEALEHPWTRGLSFLPADYRPPAHRGVDFSASARTSTTSSSRQSSSSCYTSGAVAASFTSAGAVADGGGSGGGNNCGAQAYHHGQQHQRMQQSGPGQLLHPASCIGEDHGEWRQRQWQEEGQTAGVGGSNIVRHNNWQQQPPPQHLQQENAGGGAGAAAPLAPTSAMVAATRAVAVAADAPQATVDPLTQAPVELRLGLLVKIQGCIASSLGLAFHLMLRSDRPRVAAEMVQGALVCQRELHLTIRLLRKVSDTAALVLALFPDLQLALREGEMTLARSFFVSIKNWIQEIRLELQALQRSNEQAMAQMARIIKKAARELVGSHKLVQHRERERREQRLLSDRQRSEGQGPQRQQQQQDGSSKKGRLDGPTDPVSAPASASAAPLQQQQGGGGVEGLSDEDLLDLLLPDVHCEARRDAHTSSSLPAVAEEGGAYERKVEELTGVLNDLLPAEVVEPLRVVGDGSARQLEDRQVRRGSFIRSLWAGRQEEDDDVWPRNSRTHVPPHHATNK